MGLHQPHFPVLTIMILGRDHKKNSFFALIPPWALHRLEPKAFVPTGIFIPNVPNQQTNQKKAEEDSEGRGKGLYWGICDHPSGQPCALLAVLLS